MITSVKRYVYNWSRPDTSDNYTIMSPRNDKCVGNERDKYETVFSSINEKSWKGDRQTLNCLRKIMEIIEKYVFIVVVGYIQSGKSALMLYFSYWMCSQHNMNVVVILRNCTEDIYSLKEKFTNFKKEKNLKNYDLEIVTFVNYKARIDKSDFIEKMQSSKKIFLLLGNAEQLSKMNELVEAGDINPFVICVDEMDLNDKNDTTKFQCEFDKLKNCGYVVNILGVSGTALPVMFKKIDSLTNEQIIRLDAPINYKGIHNITFTEIDIQDNDIVKNTMLRMLKSSYAFFTSNVVDKHPAILLIKDDRVKQTQMDMLNMLTSNTDIKKNWILIVWNGDGLVLKTPWGTSSVYNDMGINDALQKIKDDDRMKTVKYIGIISGDLANRGISFVSKDYKWHLTHMILAARPSSTGTSLIQASRLCGCYNDEIPLEMFTSMDIQKELFAYDYLQQASLDKCESLIDSTQLRKTLSSMKLKPECVVRRPIDLRMVIKYKYLSNYDKIMCGEKINANTIITAQDIIKNQYNEIPLAYLVEEKTEREFNEENIKKIKKELKESGYNHINVIKKKFSSLIKNPQHVTSSYKNANVMIYEIDNNIVLYKKSKQELHYNQLFLFQTPSGIYLSKSTENKDELQDMFKNFITLDL